MLHTTGVALRGVASWVEPQLGVEASRVAFVVDLDPTFPGKRQDDSTLHRHGVCTLS